MLAEEQEQQQRGKKHIIIYNAYGAESFAYCAFFRHIKINGQVRGKRKKLQFIFFNVCALVGKTCLLDTGKLFVATRMSVVLFVLF
jgi:hypothetical protein